MSPENSEQTRPAAPVALRVMRAYPFLAGLFPVLALYAHNQRYYRLPDLLPAMAGSLLVTGVLWLLAVVLWRDADRRAFAVFVLVACFHLSGRVASHLGGMPILVLDREMDIGTIAAWAVALLGVGLLVCRLPVEGREVTRALAVFSIILVAPPIARITKVEVQRLARRNLDFQGGSWSVARPVPSAQTPHIFYVVADTYARQDVLAEYGFDNSPFLDALRQRGFFVASRSLSPFPHTIPSMASTLNMSYHGVQSLRSELGDQLTGSRALNHNRVAKLLHARGYSFVAFAHGYEMAEARMADVFLDVRPRRRLDGRFFQTAIDLTALRVLAVRWKLGQKRIEGLHRERVLFALERTPKLASSQGPVFAYVHILCPHGPIVFDAQGNTPPLFVDRRGWSPETPEARHGYVEQTKYLNGRLLQMVDEILAAATRPVVIVLQGDHGPRLLLKPGEGCDPNRLKILNAYLFPDRQYQKLSDSISPVNTFRVILSQYLGYDIPLLPDRREDPAGQECPTGLTDETERER